MSFKKLFQAQDFAKAAEAFAQLSIDEKSTALKELFYTSRNAQMPVAIAVLRRQLHQGNTFKDFYNAWLPPTDTINPVNIGEATYYQHFAAPVRVINACNMNDANDIISVALNWCTKEEFRNAIKEIETSKTNSNRHNSIDTVADLKSAELFWVETDTNLGT